MNDVHEPRLTFNLPKIAEKAMEETTKTPERMQERDRRRVEEWIKASESMPSEDELAQLDQSVAEAQALLEDALTAQRTAAVKCALLVGFTTIAERYNVSAKEIHKWHRTYAPELEDLSSIPQKEMKREKARAEKLKKEIEGKKRVEESLERIQKNIEEARNRHSAI